MRYKMTVDLIERGYVTNNKIFHFSEERWLTARLQVITLLKAFHTNDSKLLTLYLTNNDLKKLKNGVYYPDVTIRGIFDKANFTTSLFTKAISFDVLKHNLLREKDIYTTFSKTKVLTEQVGLTKTTSIELLKGTNKLLYFYSS